MNKKFIVIAGFLFLQTLAFGDQLPLTKDINMGWGFYNICHNLNVNTDDTNMSYLKTGVCIGYILGILNQYLTFLDAVHGHNGKFYDCYWNKYGPKNFSESKVMGNFISFLENNPDYLKAPTDIAFDAMMVRKFPLPKECLAITS